ncbi:hypothetical protein GCM10010124_29560 [Pilimelia terevasa]|uniref:Uncharacterized protein n=1 Tax=Pilimelia terevasa TaxID=53372 RepID=A0A8J3FJ43_9ACTN|nr:hypothetical protein [Pilimelia terevasa]GGK34992.1 hypothetical protein GCM10010124_29560 [Pilimelia terevasa]
MFTTPGRRGAAIGVLVAGLGAGLAAAPAQGTPRGRHAGYGACAPYAAISSAPGLATTYFYRRFQVASTRPAATCVLEVPVTAYPGNFDGDVRIAASASGTLALGPGAAATVVIDSGMRGQRPTRHTETRVTGAARRWTAVSTTVHRLPRDANLTFVIRVTVTLAGPGARVAVTSISADGTDLP